MRLAVRHRYSFLSPLTALLFACAFSAGVVNAQDTELDDDMSSVDVTSGPITPVTDADDAAG